MQAGISKPSPLPIQHLQMHQALTIAQEERRGSANTTSILTNKSDQERTAQVVLILPLAFALTHCVTA